MDMIKTSVKSRKILAIQVGRMVRNVSEDIQITPVKLMKDLATVMSWCIGPNQEKVTIGKPSQKG